jgi:hypothetical protein
MPLALCHRNGKWEEILLQDKHRKWKGREKTGKKGIK